MKPIFPYRSIHSNSPISGIYSWNKMKLQIVLIKDNDTSKSPIGQLPTFHQQNGPGRRAMAHFRFGRTQSKKLVFRTIFQMRKLFDFNIFRSVVSRSANNMKGGKVVVEGVPEPTNYSDPLERPAIQTQIKGKFGNNIIRNNVFRSFAFL